MIICTPYPVLTVNHLTKHESFILTGSHCSKTFTSTSDLSRPCKAWDSKSHTTLANCQDGLMFKWLDDALWRNQNSLSRNFKSQSILIWDYYITYYRDPERNLKWVSASIWLFRTWANSICRFVASGMNQKPGLLKFQLQSYCINKIMARICAFFANIFEGRCNLLPQYRRVHPYLSPRNTVLIQKYLPVNTEVLLPPACHAESQGKAIIRPGSGPRRPWNRLAATVKSLQGFASGRASILQYIRVTRDGTFRFGALRMDWWVRNVCHCVFLLFFDCVQEIFMMERGIYVKCQMNGIWRNLGEPNELNMGKLRYANR